MIHQIIVTVIQKRIRVPGKWVILGPKMMCSHNSGLTLDCIIKAYLWIALTTLDFTTKRTKGYIQIILFFQNKKIVWGEVVILGAKITLHHNSISVRKTFFNILHSERSQEVPAGIYLLKVNNKITRTRCEICSKLTIKIPEWHHWRRSGNFIVNFEHISQLVLVFLLLLWTCNCQLGSTI